MVRAEDLSPRLGRLPSVPVAVAALPSLAGLGPLVIAFPADGATVNRPQNGDRFGSLAPLTEEAWKAFEGQQKRAKPELAILFHAKRVSAQKGDILGGSTPFIAQKFSFLLNLALGRLLNGYRCNPSVPATFHPAEEFQPL